MRVVFYLYAPSATREKTAGVTSLPPRNLDEKCEWKTFIACVAKAYNMVAAFTRREGPGNKTWQFKRNRVLFVSKQRTKGTSPETKNRAAGHQEQARKG